MNRLGEIRDLRMTGLTFDLIWEMSLTTGQGVAAILADYASRAPRVS